MKNKTEEKKTPPRQQPVGMGLEMGWDLRDVDSSYLVGELIRRGHYELSKIEIPCPKKEKSKTKKKGK